MRIVGGLLRAVNVWIDAERLAAYQIPINAVRDALVRQNADVPGGNVTGDRTEATLSPHHGPPTALIFSARLGNRTQTCENCP